MGMDSKLYILRIEIFQGYLLKELGSDKERVASDTYRAGIALKKK